MTEAKPTLKTEFRQLILSAIIPGCFIFIACMVFLLEVGLNIELSSYGLKPRSFSQWFGILTMPFLHSDFTHLVYNSISFMVLGTMLFYFYKKQALLVFLLSYLLAGSLTWIIGRDSIHIGASAMIYAFVGYIFTAGVLSKNKSNIAVSLLVVFMYGSLIWGVFPQETNISWEGHLSGFISGIGLAFIYKPAKSIETEEVEMFYTDFNSSNVNCTENDEVEIKYFYKKEEKTSPK
jgi:membrane associated rhomboid family serine protease